MSADGGSVKKTLGSESSCSSTSSTDTTRRKKEYGKKDRKIVRILTVVAYVVCVSLAAVLLSTYYVFLWSPDTVKPSTEQPRALKNTQSKPLSNFYKSSHQRSKFLAVLASAAPRNAKGSAPYYLHYTNAKTNAYQLNQIPTPQPLLMMTKILTTVSDGGTTSTTTTTTPSPPVRKRLAETP